MKLLLHAGPMKTGSTAFQELLGVNRSLLEHSGIRFRHLRRQELDDLEAVMETRKDGVGRGCCCSPMNVFVGWIRSA